MQKQSAALDGNHRQRRPFLIRSRAVSDLTRAFFHSRFGRGVRSRPEMAAAMMRPPAVGEGARRLSAVCVRAARHSATEGYKFRERVSRELLNAYERGLGKHDGVTRERS